jgi:hypothetical protein
MEHHTGSTWFPDAPALSFARYQCWALFKHGDRAEGPYQTLLEFDRVSAGRIVGYVIGDRSAVESLRFPRGELRLESVRPSGTPTSDIGGTSGAATFTSWIDTRLTGRVLREDCRLASRVGPLAMTFPRTSISQSETLRTRGLRQNVQSIFLTGTEEMWSFWRSTHEEMEALNPQFSDAVLDCRPSCNFDLRFVPAKATKHD